MFAVIARFQQLGYDLALPASTGNAPASLTVLVKRVTCPAGYFGRYGNGALLLLRALQRGAARFGRSICAGCFCLVHRSDLFVSRIFAQSI